MQCLFPVTSGLLQVIGFRFFRYYQAIIGLSLLNSISKKLYVAKITYHIGRNQRITQKSTVGENLLRISRKWGTNGAQYSWNSPKRCFAASLPLRGASCHKAKNAPEIVRGIFGFVTPLGFEPKTHSLEGCCSIQLSYGAPFAPAKILHYFNISNHFDMIFMLEQDNRQREPVDNE